MSKFTWMLEQIQNAQNQILTISSIDAEGVVKWNYQSKATIEHNVTPIKCVSVQRDIHLMASIICGEYICIIKIHRRVSSERVYHFQTSLVCALSARAERKLCSLRCVLPLFSGSELLWDVSARINLIKERESPSIESAARSTQHCLN